MITGIRTAITTTKPATQVYSWRRKARAPAWICVMIDTISSLPGGADFTSL